MKQHLLIFITTLFLLVNLVSPKQKKLEFDNLEVLPFSYHYLHYKEHAYEGVIGEN